MLVTAIAVVGVLPYIALQLKGVSFGFEVLASTAPEHAGIIDGALAIALMLAAFAILFGTRDLLSTENHHGMVLAIAFESLVKLAAFLAVGVYVVYGCAMDWETPINTHCLTGNFGDRRVMASGAIGFLSQTLLAAAAMLCLPRQFHVAVVENTVLSDLRAARWIFPAYLAIISLFVLPFASSGLERFSSTVSADTFLLVLPLSATIPGWR